MAEEQQGVRVTRILYKEIVEGDRRKIRAQSNDSDTGGGARDFRFGSYEQLLPVIKRMFPNVVKEPRRRGKAISRIDVFQGDFYWQRAGSGAVEHKSSFFEPPTDVRPSEGRIVRVHEYACFDTKLIPPHGNGDRVLLLLIQRSDANVWPHFVTERSLRTPGEWDRTVAAELLSCIDAARPANRAVIGYRDFDSHESYCNGK